MKSFLIKLLATGFGLGYSPIIPGTIGSIPGIIIFFIFTKLRLQPFISIPFILVLFFFGVFISTAAEKLFGKKDARQIVIDEIVGCLIYLYLVPFEIWHVTTGFIVYRILDIIKPCPAGNLQKLNGGWGIMADDVIAGFYTGVIVNIGIWLKNLS